ncbi:DUF2752 domain-containing protein [Marinilabiliaceae bacterium ANBcel2]|nr:DUF2752 domain-containing protein [Marinilabiliaceae bacterium ANBcel2]
MHGVYFKKVALIFSGIILFVLFAILYRGVNPESSILFPKCIFKSVTGFDCPGCGSQRAVHYLLNMDIVNAAGANFLLLLSIPYIIVGLIFDFVKPQTSVFLNWRKLLYGQNAIIIILIVVILFWFFRNIV